MAIIRAFIKRHQVSTYVAITFAILWGGILLVVGGTSGLPGTAAQLEKLLLFVMLALFAGPGIAGMAMTGVVRGRAGFPDLISRMTTWRMGIRWYAVASLTAPLMFTAVSLALSVTSAKFLPGILTATDKAALLLFGISYGLVGGGFLEELGWTGFAIPTLVSHYSALRTGLIVGLLWGAWHFVVIFWMSDPSGESPLTRYSCCLPTSVPAEACSWQCLCTRVSRPAC